MYGYWLITNFLKFIILLVYSKVCKHILSRGELINKWPWNTPYAYDRMYVKNNGQSQATSSYNFSWHKIYRGNVVMFSR